MNNSSVPLLTIIVPVYVELTDLENLREWVQLAMDKSLNVEIVLVQDGPVGRLNSCLMEIAAQYRRSEVKLLYSNACNPGSARNLGLEVATGDWVCFWDADDHPNLVDVYQATLTAGSTTNVLIGNYEVLETKSHTLRSSKPNHQLNQLVPEIAWWRFVFRRRRIEGCEMPPLRMGEDQAFIAKLVLSDSEVQFVNTTFYRYVVGRKDQLTGNKLALKDLPFALYDVRTRITPLTRDDNYTIGILTRIAITVILKLNWNLKFNAMQTVLRVVFQVSGLRIIKRLKMVLRCVVSSLRPSTTMCKPGVKVALAGGLGNQLFQLAAALGAHSQMICLEQNLGKPRMTQGVADVRFLLLPFRVKLDGRYRHKLTQRAVGFSLRRGIQPQLWEQWRMSKMILDFATRVFFSLVYKENTKVFVSQNVGFDPDFPGGAGLCIGYFQSYRYANHASVQEELMALRPRTRSPRLQELQNLARIERPTIVHIRLGDYVHEPSFGMLAPRYYAEALEELGTNSSTNVWFFSNSPDQVQRLYLRLMPGKLTIIEDRELTSAELFELMRFGDNYVIGNSTLSWWAASLRYNRNGSVIAPNPWFKSLPEPCDLIPEHWQRKRSVWS